VKHTVTESQERCAIWVGRQSGFGLAVLFLLLSSTAWGVQWEVKPSWNAEGQSWNAAGPGPRWDTLLSKTKHRDGSFSAVVRITKAADLNVPNPSGNWYGPGAGMDKTMPGYEAGLVFRHRRSQSYRVCLSSFYKEVGLWRTDGGWLAVREAPLSVNTDHVVRVDFCGNRIKVFVDKQEILDVTDCRPLLGEGQLGLAVKQGRTSFSATEVEAVEPLRATPATPSFAYKKWHNQDWFFNGLEPIARLDGKLNLHCKVAACYRMIGFSPACWIQYAVSHANKNAKLEVLQSGDRLKCLIQGMTPNGEIVSKYVMTITLDPALNFYAYDFDTEFTVQQGKTWHNTRGPEFSDFLPYNVVGPGVKCPENWPHYYGWLVWQAKDGKLYKHPVNHNGYYPALGDRKDTFTVKTDGGFIGFFNEEVNPVTRVVQAQGDIDQALCAWAHDLHLAYFRPKEPMKAGTRYAIRFQLLGYDKAKGAELLNAASFPPDAQHLDWEYPYYESGVNDFQQGVKVASPHQVQLWHKGCAAWAWNDPPDFWDRTVGYRDNASLRIEGPHTIGAGIGSSWFMPAFTAKRHLISAMVKTENVKGEGPLLGFICSHNKGANGRFITGINGTRDWTKVAFVTEKLTGFIQGPLFLGLSGTGKVWFDDVEIRALKDDESVTLPPLEKAPPSQPVPNMLVWLKMDDGQGAGAFDYSHNGNSAELRGVAWVEDEAKGPCVQFDGKGVATIESRDELNFATPFSFTGWLKPAAPMPGGGTVFRKYNFLRLFLHDTKAPHRIAFTMNGKWNQHTTTGIVPGDTWSHIALTHDKKTVRIYLNGAKVWEKEQPEEKVMPTGFPLCLGGFRHDGCTSGSFSGRMAQLKFLRKALSEDDVKKDFETGKPSKK